MMRGYGSEWTCERCPGYPGSRYSDRDYDDWPCMYNDEQPDNGKSSSNTDEKMWKLITEMNHEPFVGKVPNHQVKNLIRSQHTDISVKVDTDIYQLDKVHLALKSDYFEKLLTSDFYEKDTEFIEICTMDSDTFSTILDVIYGEELEAVLHIDNYVELLLAMDYLQMEIDLDIFRNFLNDNFKLPLSEFPNIWKLLNSIAENPNFNYFLPTVRQYFSIHLLETLECEEFPSLMLSQLVEVIKINQFPQYDEEKYSIGEICAKWICADIENRLPYIADLVNAAKFRYAFPFRIRGEFLNMRHLLHSNEAVKQQMVARYFQKLLNYDGETDPTEEQDTKDESKPDPTNNIIYKIDGTDKWKMFLDNEYFYDITVKIEGKTYKLHRCKLNSSSGYFARLAENSSSRKDDEHLLDEIDPVIFDAIIKHIYYKNELELTFANIALVLKASDILKIPNLVTQCKSFMKNLTKISKVCIEVLNFTCGKKDYRNEFEKLTAVVVENWSEISRNQKPTFFSISFDGLTSILHSQKLKIESENELLDVCSKWIMKDLKNRYSLMPEIANAINCNFMAVYDDCETEIATDLNNCSQDFIKNKLRRILSSTAVIQFGRVVSEQNSKFEDHLMFVSVRFYQTAIIDIFDACTNKIASMCALKLSNEDFQSSLSATIVNDNVFILSKINGKYCFNAYSLSSKKFFSLNFDLKNEHFRSDDVTMKLLNCNDQVYCCFGNGRVLRYSIELNRWMVFSARVPAAGEITFSSCGKTLYRIYDPPSNGPFAYVAEAYNFKDNKWRPLPDLPHEYSLKRFTPSMKRNMIIDDLTIIGDLVIAFKTVIFVFNDESKKWYRSLLPSFIEWHNIVSISTYRENRTLCIATKQGLIYRGSFSKAKYFLETTFHIDDYFRAIHRPAIVCQPQEEAYAQQGDILIEGVPVVEHESIDVLVLDMAKVAGVLLTKNDIELSRRILFTNTNAQPSKILIRFVKGKEKQKNQFLKALLKNPPTLEALGFTGMECSKRKIFIKECPLPQRNRRVDAKSIGAQIATSI